MIKITEAWRASHAHLEPYRHHLPLASEQLCRCPQCGEDGAFKVVADLQPVEAPRLSGVEVLYCPGCADFMVEPSLLGGECDSSSLRVDARLWSPLPTFLNIEPTTRCNFRCWYCIGRHMEQRDLSKEDFATVLANVPDIRVIALVGEGEPLVHPDFFVMASLAVAEGKKVMISSNGSLLTEVNARKLCESGVSYISISIDSADPAIFANSRVKGDLAQVMRNISRLKEIRDAGGYRYPRIGLKGTLFDYNQNELPGIVSLALQSGVDIFECFQAINPKQSYVDIYPEEHRQQLAALERVQKAITRDSVEAQRVLRPAADFLAEEGIDFGRPGKANGLRPNCDEQHIYALLTGDVTPCCQVKQVLDAEWNLFRHPLAQVFRHPRYENMRFNLWNGIFPEYCRGCEKTPAVSIETPGEIAVAKASPPSQWQVGWATEADEAELLALFAKVFGHPMPPAHWRWKYAASETTGALVRKLSDQVVAFFGGMPRPIYFFGEAATAIQIGDVMTDPGQGRVLSRQGPFFLATATYLERFIGPDKAYRLGFGFPSKRHHRLAERLGLYAAVGDIQEAGWQPLPYRPSLAVRVRPFSLAETALVDPLWDEMARELAAWIVPVKDAAYFRHRFLQHPTLSYQAFLVRRRFSGRPLGLLVLRDHGEAGVELLDLVGAPARLPELVRIARQVTGKLGRPRLFAWLSKPVAEAIAASNPILTATDIVIPTSIWQIPAEVERLYDRWWLMGGDADFR